jgi:ribose 1,5-bisphosphokinase PhnN
MSKVQFCIKITLIVVVATSVQLLVHLRDDYHRLVVMVLHVNPTVLEDESNRMMRILNKHVTIHPIFV